MLHTPVNSVRDLQDHYVEAVGANFEMWIIGQEVEPTREEFELFAEVYREAVKKGLRELREEFRNG